MSLSMAIDSIQAVQRQLTDVEKKASILCGPHYSKVMGMRDI